MSTVATNCLTVAHYSKSPLNAILNYNWLGNFAISLLSFHNPALRCNPVAHHCTCKSNSRIQGWNTIRRTRILLRNEFRVPAIPFSTSKNSLLFCCEYSVLSGGCNSWWLQTVVSQMFVFWRISTCKIGTWMWKLFEENPSENQKCVKEKPRKIK